MFFLFIWFYLFSSSCVWFYGNAIIFWLLSGSTYFSLTHVVSWFACENQCDMFTLSASYFHFISQLFISILLVVIPGSCRKLFFCSRSIRGHNKTWKDEHVRDTFGNLGTCQGRDPRKANKYRSCQSYLCLPNNVPCLALCLLICKVWCEEGCKKRSCAARCQASKELFQI